MNLKYAKRSEDTEQIHVIEWAMWNQSRYPELKWLHHIPNGGSRNHAEAVKFKQMGVKAGVSDLHLPFKKGTYIGLYIEMKYGKNKLTPEQIDFLTTMQAAGHLVVVCYSYMAAIEVLQQYLELTPNGSLILDKLNCKNRVDKNSLIILE